MGSRYNNQSGVKDVWCDGSTLGNGQEGARSGVGVYWGPNNPQYVRM